MKNVISLCSDNTTVRGRVQQSQAVLLHPSDAAHGWIRYVLTILVFYALCHALTAWSCVAHSATSMVQNESKSNPTNHPPPSIQPWSTMKTPMKIPAAEASFEASVEALGMPTLTPHISTISYSSGNTLHCLQAYGNTTTITTPFVPPGERQTSTWMSIDLKALWKPTFTFMLPGLFFPSPQQYFCSHGGVFAFKWTPSSRLQ